MKLLNSIDDAFDEIDRHLSEALLSGKLMMVVVHVDDESKVVCKKVTWNFPVAMFNDAVEGLRSLLRKETLPDTSPLPVAVLPGDTDDSKDGKMDSQLD